MPPQWEDLPESGFIAALGQPEIGDVRRTDGKPLEAGVPVTFTHGFVLACRAARAPDSNPLLVKGHRYRFAMREGGGVTWWKYGTKDEVMSAPGEDSAFDEPENEPILFDQDVSVEFDVV